MFWYIVVILQIVVVDLHIKHGGRFANKMWQLCKILCKFFFSIVIENLKYWAIFGRVAIAFFLVEYSNMDVNVQDIPNVGIPSKDQVWDKSIGRLIKVNHVSLVTLSESMYIFTSSSSVWCYLNLEFWFMLSKVFSFRATKFLSMEVLFSMCLSKDGNFVLFFLKFGQLKNMASRRIVEFPFNYWIFVNLC